MTVDLITQLKIAGLPLPVEEYEFHPERKWRFDWCYPSLMLAIEREGGTTLKGGGRHNRAAGFEMDCRKYSEAALLGWVVLRFTTQMVASGEALTLIERALKERANAQAR